MAAKTKFKFGVDADNVLADSAGKAVELINERRKFSKPVTRDEITRRPFHLSPGFVERGVSQDEVSKALDEVWRIHYKEIKLMDERLPKVIEDMRHEGVSIEIITTMGERDPLIQPHMSVFLDVHDVAYDKLDFVKGSGAKLNYEAFPVHTIVDDEQSLAVSLATAERPRPGLVYDAPWNREFVAEHKSNPNANKLIIPVKDWSETGEAVFRLMEALRT